MKAACKTTIDLELTAEFRSAVLSIRGGRITSVLARDCDVSAALTYGKISFPGVKSGEIELAAPYEFRPPGLEIAS